MKEVNRYTMFLREHISLPAGITLAVEHFCDGWVILNSGDAPWLKKKVTDLGWNFITLTDVHSRRGIARSAPEAIQIAVRRALQRINSHFNAAEVENVAATRRLWLYIAEAIILSRQIQESPFLDGSEELSVHHASETFAEGDQ